MTTKQYLGLVGFAFVAVWIAASFGSAVLCLIGAAAFYGAGGVIQGEIDLGELQERLRRGGGGGTYSSRSRVR